MVAGIAWSRFGSGGKNAARNGSRIGTSGMTNAKSDETNTNRFLIAGDNEERASTMNQLLNLLPIAQVEQVGNSLSSWTANNGLAVVLLFMVLISIGLAGWRTMNWSASNVVIPMRDAFIKHLDTTDETMQEVKTSMQGIHAEIQQTRSSQDLLHSKQDLLHNKLDELSKRSCKTSPS
jgi:hypothetical protein